jgi:hypothetical protein
LALDRRPRRHAVGVEVGAFDQGIRDLYRTAADGGVFCYTFFKGVGTA